jgi:hypothetical protein
MPQDITLELSISPDEASERLELAVMRPLACWDADRPRTGSERLMGRVGSHGFRVFLLQRRSRGCPRYATGHVRGREGGSCVGVHIGLKAWDRFGMLVGLSSLAVAAAVALTGLVLLSSEGVSFLPNAALVVVVWLATTGMLIADWRFGRGEEPALRRALEALYDDVTVAVHESI